MSGITILTSSDPQINAIVTDLRTMAGEAIAWFDMARRVDALANTVFTFTLTRLTDAKEETKTIDGVSMPVISFYKEDKDNFELSRGGGAAFDRSRETQSLHFQSLAVIPLYPIASVPVDIIINEDKLVKKVVEALRAIEKQCIQKIELKVELFDINKNQIDTKTWKLRDPALTELAAPAG